MEIQKYNQNSIAVFDGSEKSIIKAIQSELVNNVSDDTLDDRLTDLVKASHLIAGIKHSGNLNELITTVNEIIAELRFNKTNIRIDEIEIAFKNGVHKKYGDYYGLNAVTFCFFIREYLKEESRLEAIRLKNAPEESKKPSDEEIHKISIQNCISAFKEMELYGSVGRFGLVVYDFLESIGIINLDVPTKKEYWENAKIDLAEHLQSKLFNNFDKHDVSRLKNQLNMLVSNEKNQTTEDKLRVISKRLAVDDYFRELMMNEQTIENILSKN